LEGTGLKKPGVERKKRSKKNRKSPQHEQGDWGKKRPQTRGSEDEGKKNYGRFVTPEEVVSAQKKKNQTHNNRNADD